MPVEVFHPPYPPITQSSRTGDWLKTEKRNLPAAHSTTTSYPGLGLAGALVPAALDSKDKVFPKLLAHHEAKVLPAP